MLRVPVSRVASLVSWTVPPRSDAALLTPPRYMSKGRHARAYESMCRLRYCKVQAARDQFYMYKGLEAEAQIQVGRNKIAELVSVPRNRRGMMASELIMFMQQ